MFIAVAHIGGSIIAILMLGVVALLIGAWHQKRIGNVEMQHIASRIGVTVDDVNDEKHMPQFIDFMSERFSIDHFSNRFSDLCWWVLGAWNWLGLLLQIGLLGWVIWLTYSESAENAIYAWGVVAEALFFWIVGWMFSLLCRLLTGRYPGQAKGVRKGLSEMLETRKAKHAQPYREYLEPE